MLYLNLENYLFFSQYLFPFSSFNSNRIEINSSISDLLLSSDLNIEEKDFPNSEIILDSQVNSINKNDNQMRIFDPLQDVITGQDNQFSIEMNHEMAFNITEQKKSKDILDYESLKGVNTTNSKGFWQNDTSLNQYFVAPNHTDSNIDDSFGLHYAVSDSAVMPKNQLLVFLPGTRAKPIVYQLFAQEAAKLGYHAIGLSYPNSQTVSEIADYQNLDTFGEIRGEILDGVDRTDAITIDRSNSIENRLIKLLNYLDTQHPQEGWRQYLNGDTLVWNSIAIAGHSQGGGQAAFIAKEHELARVIMFSPGLDSAGYYGFAPWVSEPHLTPSDRYYGFIHENDRMVKLDKTLEGWDILGLDTYNGYPENIDSQVDPYHGSHQLTTDSSPRIPRTEHGSIIVDSRVPFLPDGTPLYQDAWQYLLGDTTTATQTVPDFF